MNPFQSESSLLREEETFQRQRQEVIDRMNRRYVEQQQGDDPLNQQSIKRGVNGTTGSLPEALPSLSTPFQPYSPFGNTRQYLKQLDRDMLRTAEKTHINATTQPDQIYLPNQKTEQKTFLPSKKVIVEVQDEKERTKDVNAEQRERREALKREKERRDKIERYERMQMDERMQRERMQRERMREERERREQLILARRFDVLERRNVGMEKKQKKSKIQARQLPVCKYERNNEQCASDLQESCAICTFNYSQGEQIIRMPCFHFFHQDCCKQWLQVKPNCPTCNYQL